MPSTIDEFNPRCPIDDVPNELLSYFFQLGVEMEQEGDIAKDGVIIYSNDSTTSTALSVDSATDSEDEQIEHGDTLILPFQVLVSHVCPRWRSVAINTHRLWTELTFRVRPRLVQMKEYISRSNGLPLTIDLDCYTDDFVPVDPEELDYQQVILSLEDLDQILDLLEPAVLQWRSFDFYSRSYSFLLLLMSRLERLPAAPCLESFKVQNIWDGVEREPPEYNTRYLPFNGQAPNLKEVVFREIHIDWERALPNFLRGLRDFELTHPKTDFWPTYATFAKIIKHSPELRTLNLSNAGPLLADNVAFDSHSAWGPIPLAIPSLTTLEVQFLDQKYAIALVQHLDIPNVTRLVLNFDILDYSDLVQALATPVKGRTQSLLRQITHLSMIGFSFNRPSMKALLSESLSLKSLYLQPPRREEKVVCDALVDPKVLAIGSSSVELPEFFCPKLEEITTSFFGDNKPNALIIGRRNAGVPLKRVRQIGTLC